MKPRWTDDYCTCQQLNGQCRTIPKKLFKRCRSFKQPKNRLLRQTAERKQEITVYNKTGCCFCNHLSLFKMSLFQIAIQHLGPTSQSVSISKCLLHLLKTETNYLNLNVCFIHTHNHTNIHKTLSLYHPRSDINIYSVSSTFIYPHEEAEVVLSKHRLHNNWEK